MSHPPHGWLSSIRASEIRLDQFQILAEIGSEVKKLFQLSVLGYVKQYSQL